MKPINQINDESAEDGAIRRLHQPVLHYMAHGDVRRVLNALEANLSTTFPGVPDVVAETLRRTIQREAQQHGWDTVAISLSKGIPRQALDEFLEKDFSHKGPIIVDPTAHTPDYETFNRDSILQARKERLIRVNEGTGDIMMILVGTQHDENLQWHFEMETKERRIMGIVVDELLERQKLTEDDEADERYRKRARLEEEQSARQEGLTQALEVSRTREEQNEQQRQALIRTSAALALASAAYSAREQNVESLRVAQERLSRIRPLGPEEAARQETLQERLAAAITRQEGSLGERESGTRLNESLESRRERTLARTDMGHSRNVGPRGDKRLIPGINVASFPIPGQDAEDATPEMILALAELDALKRYSADPAVRATADNLIAQIQSVTEPYQDVDAGFFNLERQAEELGDSRQLTGLQGDPRFDRVDESRLSPAEQQRYLDSLAAQRSIIGPGTSVPISAGADYITAQTPGQQPENRAAGRIEAGRIEAGTTEPASSPETRASEPGLIAAGAAAQAGIIATPSAPPAGRIEAGDIPEPSRPDIGRPDIGIIPGSSAAQEHRAAGFEGTNITNTPAQEERRAAGEAGTNIITTSAQLDLRAVGEPGTSYRTITPQTQAVWEEPVNTPAPQNTYDNAPAPPETRVANAADHTVPAGARLYAQQNQNLPSDAQTEGQAAGEPQDRTLSARAEGREAGDYTTRDNAQEQGRAARGPAYNPDDDTSARAQGRMAGLPQQDARPAAAEGRAAGAPGSNTTDVTPRQDTGTNADGYDAYADDYPPGSATAAAATPPPPQAQAQAQSDADNTPVSEPYRGVPIAHTEEHQPSMVGQMDGNGEAGESFRDALRVPDEPRNGATRQNSNDTGNSGNNTENRDTVNQYDSMVDQNANTPEAPERVVEAPAEQLDERPAARAAAALGLDTNREKQRKRQLERTPEPNPEPELPQPEPS
jgi:hypothetical protein